MRQRLWYLLVPTVACAAITAAVTAFYLPTRYQSDTLILVVPQRVPESYVPSSVTATIVDRLSSIQQQVLSRRRLERIIDDFDLYADERRTGIMEDVVEGMRKDINIEVVKGDALRVAYKGDHPRTVMRVTELLMSLFIEENLRDREELADRTAHFLESQMEETRDRLIAKEAELKGLPATASAAALVNREQAKMVVDQQWSLLDDGLDLLDRARAAERLIEREAPTEALPARASGPALSEADRLEYEVLRDSYNALLFNREQARMAANLERQQIGEQFKLLDPARLPEEPIGPGRGPVNVAGAGVGLALGLVAILVRRKKLSADPGAAAAFFAQGRLSAAPPIPVFRLLYAVLVITLLWLAISGKLLTVAGWVVDAIS